MQIVARAGDRWVCTRADKRAGSERVTPFNRLGEGQGVKGVRIGLDTRPRCRRSSRFSFLFFFFFFLFSFFFPFLSSLPPSASSSRFNITFVVCFPSTWALPELISVSYAWEKVTRWFLSISSCVYMCMCVCTCAYRCVWSGGRLVEREMGIIMDTFLSYEEGRKMSCHFGEIVWWGLFRLAWEISLIVSAWNFVLNVSLNLRKDVCCYCFSLFLIFMVVVLLAFNSLF